MVKTKSFYFIEELNGIFFRCFLNLVAGFCDRAILVVRDEEYYILEITSVLSKLNIEFRKEKTSTWPGTVIFGHQAVMYTFPISNFTLNKLAEMSRGIFRWSPFEDFSLLRESGTPFLTTVSHEEIADLDITEEEYKSILVEMPILSQILVPHPNPEYKFAVIRVFRERHKNNISKDLKIIKTFNEKIDAENYAENLNSQLGDDAFYFVKSFFV